MADEQATALPTEGQNAEVDYVNYGDDEGDVDADMDEIQAMLQDAEEQNKEAAALAESGKAEAADAIAKKEAEDKARQERDERSVFVQNVHFNAKAEDVANFFSTCGAIDRCTIVSDKFGQPKGFAYIEFSSKDSVANALLLDDTEFLGRKLHVVRKRTNLPAHMLNRGRGRGRGGAPGGRGAPRGRGRGMPMIPMMMPAAYMAATGMFMMPRGRGGFMPRGAPRGRGGPRGRGSS